MNKKLFVIFPLIVLSLMGYALALTPSIKSIIAKQGTLNYIGNYSDFESTTSLFSAYFFKDGRNLGNLVILAKPLDRKEIFLGLKLLNMNVIEDTNERFYVESKGWGVYWKKGLPPFFWIGNVNYTYNKMNKTLNIEGKGEINFKITEMKVTKVN